MRAKNIDLLLKVRRKPKSPRMERKRKLGRSIEERPESVDTREEFGQWEGDGIVGKGQNGFLISLVERKLGVGFLFNVQTKGSCRIVDVLDNLQARYGAHFTKIFKTITFDNGSEFAASEAIERDNRTQACCAHPCSSYERGTIENWNGNVRRYIPKGSSFERLTNDDMIRIANYINTLPRKRFRYRTPKDLWEEEIHVIMAA
ncbi:MAG: IS30 family transposase [Oscillospiraceae bacterium]|nr:IS30 family transposase [Oscillospiraceae bacterium]